MKNDKAPKSHPGNGAKHTVMVTGANRGLGLGWVQYYLAVGSTVIACCRDTDTVTALDLLINHTGVFP